MSDNELRKLIVKALCGGTLDNAHKEDLQHHMDAAQDVLAALHARGLDVLPMKNLGQITINRPHGYGIDKDGNLSTLMVHGNYEKTDDLTAFMDSCRGKA